MTDGWTGGDMAEETNDRFAHAYDHFNLRYKNTQWTGRLLEQAETAGVEGNRLLDVACGTGHSLIPMVRRGWKVTACDISSEMLKIAKEKVGEEVRFVKADMRELPYFGFFDLVWAVNDPINYLLSDQELRATLKGMCANVTPNGVVLFDVNTAATYRSFFADELVVEAGGRRLVWTGLNQAGDFVPGGISEARFEAVGETDSVHIHRQRHFPQAQMLEAITSSGLTCVDILGVREPDGSFSKPLDEGSHSKAVYICVPS